jgi:rod shape-determining protein MreD
LKFDIGGQISRKDVVQYTKYGIIAAFLLLIQLTVLDFISIASITPDLLIVLCVWISLKEGQFRALFAGFLIGLFLDIFSMDVIGTNALTKTFVAFFAGFFFVENEDYKIIGSYKFLIIVLIAAVLHNIIYLFFYLKLSEASYLVFFLKYGLASALYTTILALFPMLFRIRRK